MNTNFKLNTISAALVAAFLSNTAHAQEASSGKQQAQQEQDVEVITVKGFRGSLQRGINNKRFADGVTDSIHAEDVGKSTDQNIADALSRVTGVTVQESDGEGTRIAVRGAGASLNQISMNGVALTSGLSGGSDSPVADQSVDLSSFSSDILSSIVVQKTSSADQDEGSLGANVVLKTVKPLNIKKPRRNVEIQGRYNQFSDDVDRKLSFSLSDKFFDDTFGVIVTASDETQHTRRDEYRASWHEASINIPDGRARDAETGKVLRIAGVEGQPADFDSDTEILNDGELYALTMSQASQIINMNERNRKSITAGLQYAPTDNTDIQLDLSHSQQDILDDNQNFNMQFGLLDPNNEDDPQHDWWTVDRESSSLVKRYSRHAKGRSYRNVGGYDQKTNVATFNLEHWITEDLKMTFLAGYSRTQSDSKDNIGLFMTPNGVSATSMYDIPLTSDDPDVITLEPAGYDCTGSRCSIDVAQGLTQVNSTEDVTLNFAPSLTNILDPNLFGAANLTKYDNSNSDTNKSFFLDFDWTVDFAGITKVEFGVKSTNRVKDVVTQRDTFINGATVFNSEGEEVSLNGITTIRLADVIADDAFPADNFMAGILDGREQAYMSGWDVVDPFKALEIVTPSNGEGGKDVKLKIDNSGSRLIDQDVKAVYAKVNFEYMDGRLTGNLGLRYVETTTYSEAYSKLQFQGGGNTYDPMQLLQYADTSQPQCDAPVWLENPAGGLDRNSYPSNLQQLGTCSLYQLTHAFHRRQANTQLAEPGENIPADELDPSNDDYILQVVWENGAPVVVRNEGNPNGNNGRFSNTQEIKALADRSTSHITINDAFGNLVNAGEQLGTIANVRPFLVADEATNDVWLPSLNLNYLFSDELIGRFSATKTMARPRFDSTTPGGAIRESAWELRGSGTINNVALVPLESNNQDISLEWYFNPSSLLSVALFRKDMTNFEERVNEIYLWTDQRENYDMAGVENLNDVLFVPNQLVDSAGNPVVNELTGLPEWQETPFNSDCMPDRMMHKQLREPLTLGCHSLNMDVVRNGKGALTQGLEFSYTQNFDFLPGAFSGLGTNINYTYADSESDAEVSVTTGQVIKPLPQPYTPKHSSNVTVFWEKDGAMLRLANRYNSTQLVNRGLASGASWLESNNRLDLSASYEINKNISVSFQALNLTNESRRTFYTSTRTVMGVAGDGTPILFDEGNVMDGDGNASRTLTEYKTGRQFRLGIRGNF
ncbi:TonB-dependent receptor domain-containing protein [Paraglaciecola sp.]|uniref:TonB-dependent receptor domain-containing protein n=1 Tax=Paraglaciecola sp. TaxID=1920173 RepID=UPI003EF76871